MSSGTLTNLNDAVASPAMASALFALAGTYAGGPVAFEGSVDGGQTYPFALAVTPAAGGAAVAALTLTANQAWAGLANTVGFSHVQVRATGAVGGATATVVPTMTAAGGGGGGGGTGAVVGQVQGTDGTTARTLKTDQAGDLGIAGIGSVDADAQTNAAMGVGVTGLVSSPRLLGVLSYLYNGASKDRQRTPNVFKTVAATAAGNTALWTPAAGKKFRLMRFKVQVTANAVQAAGGVLSVGLQDATTDLNLTHSVFVPAAAGTTMAGFFDSGWINLGNGVLSALANNILNANLSAALTGGTARVIAAGVEE